MSWYCLSLVPLFLGAFCFEADLVQRLKIVEYKLKILWPFHQDGHRRMLENALSRSLMSSYSQSKQQTNYLPQYKFYTNLYEDLIILRKRLGVSLESSFKSLREGMVQDGKFEKKVRSELIASYWQFFLITMITWSFTFLSLHLIKKELSTKIALFMIILEAFGLLFFTFIFTFIKRKIFSEYNEWFTRIYRLNVYLSAGMPITQCLKESRVLDLFQSKNKKFKTFAEVLQTSVSRLQKEGTPILTDLKFCLDELWFAQECDFELFLKALSSLKLAVILIFYLGAYFVYLFSFISTFTRA